VTEDDSASASVKAKKPLREARIDVAEVPGKPGCYRAVAFLRPHFQLDELSVSLRLVADLPPQAKA
jgi:type VI secretion system protein ImpC